MGVVMAKGKKPKPSKFVTRLKDLPLTDRQIQETLNISKKRHSKLRTGKVKPSKKEYQKVYNESRKAFYKRARDAGIPSLIAREDRSSIAQARKHTNIQYARIRRYQRETGATLPEAIDELERQYQELIEKDRLEELEDLLEESPEQ
jgi:hypothetical protein